MLCQIELNALYFHSKVAKDIGSAQPESAINPAAVLETGNLNNSNLEFTSKDLGRISGDHRSDRSSSTEGPDSSVHSTSSRSQYYKHFSDNLTFLILASCKLQIKESMKKHSHCQFRANILWYKGKLILCFVLIQFKDKCQIEALLIIITY
jgi:hypothetical protein